MNTVSKAVLMDLFQRHEPEASSSPQTYREATCANCDEAIVTMWHCWLDDEGVKKELHLCDSCYQKLSTLENLVVIAAHGQEFIDGCLDSLGDQWSILVIDTHSDEPIVIPENKNVTLVRLPFKGYTTGAYLWAYWNFPAANYFFMQDSMKAKDHDYLKAFIEKKPEDGAAAWCWFEFGFDNDGQRDFAHYLYSEDADKGIFAPVFYVGRQTLDSMTNEGLLPPVPTNKNQAMASERLWAMAFKAAKKPVEFVADQWDVGKMQSGEFDIFSKTFAVRD